MDSWTNADSLRNESWRSAGEERKQIDEDGKPERKESDLAGRTSCLDISFRDFLHRKAFHRLDETGDLSTSDQPQLLGAQNVLLGGMAGALDD